MSEVDKTHAQEWLESLQQVGEGWYRQVMLAVEMGAHKALGMTRRQFAQQVGQRMIDSTAAIIELYHEGKSLAAIADVLSVGDQTVKNVLISAGLIEGVVDTSHGHKAISSVGGSDTAETSSVGGGQAELAERVDELQRKLDARTHEFADLHAQLEKEKLFTEGAWKALQEAERLREEAEQQREEAERQRRDDVREAARAAREQAEAKAQQLTDKLVAARRENMELQRQIEENAAAGKKLDEIEREKFRERAMKEAEAWAAEQGRSILAGLAHILVDQVVSGLEEAADGLRELTEQQAVSEEGMSAIDAALAAFNEELNIARMQVTKKQEHQS